MTLFQVKTANGEIRSVKFGIVIIAAGPFSAKVARMARIGTGDGMLSIPLPVEPRYRMAILVFTLIIYFLLILYCDKGHNTTPDFRILISFGAIIPLQKVCCIYRHCTRMDAHKISNWL